MRLSAPARAGSPTVLRDGRRVLLRPVVAADERPLLEFLEGLSLDSRYFRFFSLCPDLARMAHSSVPGTGDCRFGLVAVWPESDHILGHAGYWMIVPGRAEIALAVADAFRGCGLGAVLLRSLTEHALRHGLEILEADVLPENHAFMRLLMRSGWPLRTQVLQGVVLCQLVIAQPASND